MCSCNSNQRPAPSVGQARDDAIAKARAVAEARAQNSATHRIGPAPVGAKQSFALRLNDGSVQQFGSLLERDAAAARQR